MIKRMSFHTIWKILLFYPVILKIVGIFIANTMPQFFCSRIMCILKIGWNWFTLMLFYPGQRLINGYVGSLL